MNMRVRSIARGAVVSIAVISLVLTVTATPALAAAPTVASFNPTSGPPGTLVSVTGNGFTAGTGVSGVAFNGAATTFNVTDDQHLTATVPIGATTGKITVTRSDGTGTSASDFVVPANPTISSFSPSSGPPGTAVTINGSHFTGVNGVKFNGTSATFNFVSDAQVTTTVPIGATTGKITLTTPSGTATSSSNFTVTSSSPPTISSFSPSSGAVGASVTINGSHFTGATAVKFNGTSAGFSFANDGRVTAIVPAGATTGRITLTTPSGTATSSSNFTVNGGGTHERIVSLKISGRYASGTVSVNDGYSACSSNVPVVIKRFRHGIWHWVTTTSTRSDGIYRALVGGKDGRYRAKAKKITLVNGAICDGDQSSIAHH
jgi:hypothetical protein